MTQTLTTKALILTAAAAAVLSAAPAWACMPMPVYASSTMNDSQTVLVGRVTVVDQTPPDVCIAAARARVDQQFQGDPGEAGCVNFGFATVEAVRFLKGEADGAEPFRVAYNSREFCAVGWTAEVGQLVLITVPDDRSTLREGTTASLEGSLQHEPLFRTILDLVAQVPAAEAPDAHADHAH